MCLSVHNPCELFAEYLERVVKLSILQSACTAFTAKMRFRPAEGIAFLQPYKEINFLRKQKAFRNKLTLSHKVCKLKSSGLDFII